MDFEMISRHMELTPAISDHLEVKADNLAKFFDRIHDLKAVITPEGVGNNVEFIAHLVKGDVVVAKAFATDVFAAIDSAHDKLEEQLRRYKEKLREHRVKEETRGEAGA